MRHLAAGAACIMLLGGGGPADLPEAVTDGMYVTTTPAEVSLGRFLFWDPVLSGLRFPGIPYPRHRNASSRLLHHARVTV